MIAFLKLGGLPMIFVLLLAGLTIWAAVLFLLKDDLRYIALMRALSASTVFMVIAAIAAGLVAVSIAIPQLQPSANALQVLIVGIGESLAAAVVGFAALSLAWLTCAIGLRRTSNPS